MTHGASQPVRSLDADSEEANLSDLDVRLVPMQTASGAVHCCGAADEVESALRGRGIDELSGRAGYRPGQGYVHECEAADEILDESLEPFLTDLDRRARLGLTTAATRPGVDAVRQLNPAGEGSTVVRKTSGGRRHDRGGNRGVHSAAGGGPRR